MIGAAHKTHSTIADAAVGGLRWRTRFDGNDVRPRALDSLPNGLVLARASTGDFDTSSTTTATAAANEARVGQRTDYRRSIGLLVQPTSGPRADERLYHSDASALITPTGRLILEVRFIASVASTSMSTNASLWYHSTDVAYATISSSTQQLTVSIGGVTWTPSMVLAWSQYDEVTVFVAAGGGIEPTFASYAVNGGDPIDLGASVVHAPLTRSGALDLCNANTLEQIDGWVRELIAYDDPPYRIAAEYLISSTKPTGLGYARTGTWYLISNTAQTTLTAYAANVWGVQFDSNGESYLPITAAYSTVINDPRDQSAGTWTAGTVAPTTAYANGPDGVQLAARTNCGSGQFGKYQRPTWTTSVRYCASQWSRATTSGNLQGYTHNLDGSGTAVKPFNESSNAGVWKRKSHLLTGAGVMGFFVPADGDDLSAFGGLTAAARDQITDFPFAAQSLFDLPYTAGSIGRTEISIPSDVIECNGRMAGIILPAFRIKEAAADSANDHYLWFRDANNNLRLNVSNNKMILRMGGSDVVTTLAMTYAAASRVRVGVVWQRDDSCGFSLPDIDAGGSAPAVTAWTSPPTNHYVFGDGSTSNGTFPVDLFTGRSIRVLRP